MKETKSTVKKRRPKSALKKPKRNGHAKTKSEVLKTENENEKEGVAILEMRVTLKRMPLMGVTSYAKGYEEQGEEEEEDQDEFDAMRGGDEHKYIIILFEDHVHLCHTEQKVVFGVIRVVEVVACRGSRKVVEVVGLLPMLHLNP